MTDIDTSTEAVERLATIMEDCFSQVLGVAHSIECATLRALTAERDALAAQNKAQAAEIERLRGEVRSLTHLNGLKDDLITRKINEPALKAGAS